MCKVYSNLQCQGFHGSIMVSAHFVQTTKRNQVLYFILFYYVMFWPFHSMHTKKIRD